MMKGITGLMAALLLGGIASLSAASGTLEVTAEEINPVPYIKLLDNRPHKLDAKAILQHKEDWQRPDYRQINLGIGYHDWWFRLPLHNPTDQDQELVLEIPYAALDHLHFLDTADGAVQREFLTGTDYPYGSRPVDHHYFLFPISLAAGESRTLFMNVRQDGAMRVPMTLWTPDAFLRDEQRRQLIAGVYFGGMLVIVLYNLFMFFGTREISYLLYSGFVFSLPMFVSSLQGYSFQYLWPDSPEWNARSIAFFLTTTVIFGMLFTVDFLKLQREDVWWAIRYGIKGMMYACAAVLAGVLLLPYFPMLIIAVAGTVGACLLALFVGFYSWYRNERWSRYYILAWGALLVGGIVLAGNVTSILPSNFVTDNAVQFGSILLVILLSLAVADRINMERQERQQARLQALETERRARLELEDKVRERTRELESLNTRLQELSARDELTGLANRRTLDEALHREHLRALRFGRPLGLIMLDIDHFQPLNDNLGHQAGDHCLRAMGDLLREAVPRQSDILARYGGEEFCALLPDTDAQGTLTVAERIRAAVEHYSFLVNGERIPLSISAGVATLDPGRPCETDALVARADQALYRAKANGRNRVEAATP